MNGPMSDAGSAEGGANASKPWEHAWTVEEMRSTAPNWHLANDVGVCCHMFILSLFCNGINTAIC